MITSRRPVCPQPTPVGPWFLPELLALGLWFLLDSSGAASQSEGLGWMVGLPLMLRCSWQGAMLLHGLGHSLVRALVDSQASALTLPNILEQRSPGQVLAGLWTPFPGRPWFALVRGGRSHPLEGAAQGRCWAPV